LAYLRHDLTASITKPRRRSEVAEAAHARSCEFSSTSGFIESDIVV
jgi:hypothetical protein